MYNVQNLTNDVKTAKTDLTNIGIDMSIVIGMPSLFYDIDDVDENI